MQVVIDLNLRPLLELSIKLNKLFNNEFSQFVDFINLTVILCKMTYPKNKLEWNLKYEKLGTDKRLED